MAAETVVVRRGTIDGQGAVFHEQARLIRLVLFIAAGLAAVLAGVLLTRRWADALQRPLDAAGLAVLTILLVGLAVAARLLWRLADPRRGLDAARWQTVFDVTVTASVLGLAAVVSLPQSPVVPMVALWLVVLGAEGATWFVVLRRQQNSCEEETPADGSPDADLPLVEPSSERLALISGADNAFSEDDESSETLPAGVSQRMTRAREDGGEIIYGILRCDFPPNLRQQNIHIAFCPPLNSRPQLSVDQVDGPTARIRSTVVESYGAGVEVKLKSASSEPSSVQIQFCACETPPSDAAV